MSTTPLANPDFLVVLHALSRDDLSPEDAYNALEGVRNMSGQTVAAAIEAQSAKTAAQISKLDSRLETQNSQLAVLRRMVGLGFTLSTRRTRLRQLPGKHRGVQ